MKVCLDSAARRYRPSSVDSQNGPERSRGATKFRHAITMTAGKPAGPAKGSRTYDAKKRELGRVATVDRFTTADLVRLDLPDGWRAEIIDGVLFVRKAPIWDHQDVAELVFPLAETLTTHNNSFPRRVARRWLETW